MEERVVEKFTTRDVRESFTLFSVIAEEFEVRFGFRFCHTQRQTPFLFCLPCRLLFLLLCLLFLPNITEGGGGGLPMSATDTHLFSCVVSW